MTNVNYDVMPPGSEELMQRYRFLLLEALEALDSCDTVGACQRYNEEAVAVAAMKIRKLLGGKSEAI